MKEYVPWEAGAFVEKAYQDDKGKMHVVAVASDDLADLQSDQMSKSALEKMSDDANNRRVPLLDNHKSTFEFGYSVKGAVVTKDIDGKPTQQFVVDIELDGDYPQARALYREVKSKNCTKQLSIGGKLNLKNPNAITVELTEKGMVRRINDLELDHIACTRPKFAANPRTGFVSAILKSLDEEEDMDKVWEKKKEEAEAEEKEKTSGSGAKKDENIDVDEEEAAKDIEAGLGILKKIGKMFRSDGGKDMGPINKEDLSSKENLDEESTDSSDDKEQQVADALASASPGMREEEEEEKSSVDWPMDEEEEKGSEELGLGDDDENGEEEDVSVKEEDEEEEAEKSEGYEDEEEEDTDQELADELKAEDEDEFPGEESSEEETTTPEEEEAARVLMSARRRRNELRKRNEQIEDEEDIVREIALLLSKAKRLNAGTRVEKEAMRGALWNVRYLLAKNLVEKADTDTSSAASIASLIVDGGPYAPTTESAAKGSGGSNDKQEGEGDMGKNSATDANKLPAYGEAEEKAPKAPTAKESADMMMTAAQMTGKLPQANEVAEYGKSLEKSLEAVVTKSTEAATQMVTQVATKLAEVQKSQFEEISSRISQLENASGVSQSRPRGTEDVEINKSSAATGGAWSGIFGGAPTKALSKM